MGKLSLVAALVVLVGLVDLLVTTPVLAQPQTCQKVDQSTEAVVPGVTLTWDSSFLCSDAPDAGASEITVTVSNSSSSVEAVRIERLDLSHTTPRPRGQAPAATAAATGPTGLPVTINPGASARFTVSGQYELGMTDEGKKANLHLLAHGHGVASGEPFDLGINVHLRAPGVQA